MKRSAESIDNIEFTLFIGKIAQDSLSRGETEEQYEERLRRIRDMLDARLTPSDK